MRLQEGLTQARLAKRVKLSHATLNKAENMARVSRSVAAKIAKYFGVDVEYLFPASIMAYGGPRRISTAISTADLCRPSFVMHEQDRLLQPSPDDMVFATERSVALNNAIKTLSPREKIIIQMRFGLGNFKKEYTFAEVAEAFGVTRERIRQIEIGSLRKLRHPSRAHGLRKVL
jgi:RNA polymerase sigma factor (sigma-70 family)